MPAANSFFDWVVSAFRFVPRDTARAEDVNSALDTVSNGFTSVEVKTNAAIKLPNGETAAALGNAAARMGKVLSFNATTGAPEAAIATTDVATVAGSIASVNTVSANIASVVTAASNVAAIIAAPAAASSASASASAASSSAAAALVYKNIAMGITINVQDPAYGATGDGVTNDTAAIQAAINYAETVGGRVYFPDGQYAFTSLTVDSNYVSLQGAGRYSSILVCTSATGGLLFTGASLALCGVSDLGFLQSVDCTSATTALLKAVGVLNFYVEDCYFNGYYGANNYAHNLVWLAGTNVHLKECAGVGGKTYGVLLTGGNDYYVDGCSFNQTSSTGRPLLVESVSAGAAWIVNSAFLEGLECKFYASKYIQVIGSYFDSAQGAVAVDTCEHIYFNGCEFANRPGAGVAFTNSKAWSVVNSMVINCGTDGIQVNSGCSDFIVANNIIDGNNTTNAANKAGINVGVGISGFQIANNRIGNITAGFGGHQKFGIAINVGASDYYTIKGNVVTGNETLGIADYGTGLHTYVDSNIGHDPRAPQAFTAGASPYTYTAGHSAEAVYIAGGTVSNIVVDSVSLFASTDKTVLLQPNKSVVIYHSAAPLMLTSPM